jgi:hypothetical protein
MFPPRPEELTQFLLKDRWEVECLAIQIRTARYRRGWSQAPEHLARKTDDLRKLNSDRRTRLSGRDVPG